MMNIRFRRYLRYVLISASLLFVLLAFLLMAGHYLIQKPGVQKALIDRLTSDSGYAIKTGELSLNIWPGFGVRIHNLEIDSKLGLDSIQARKARIILDARRLLRRQLAITNIYLYQPRLRMSLSLDPLRVMETQERLDIFFLPFLPLSIPSVSIVDGACHFPDQGLHLKAIDLSIYQKKADPTARIIQGRGKIHSQEEAAPFSLNGLLEQTPADPVLSLEIEVKKIPLPWIPFSPYATIHNGYADTRLRFEGLPGRDISLTGQIKILSADFSIQVKEKKWQSMLPDMDLKFESRLNLHRLDFRSFKLSSGDMAISGTFSVNFDEKANPDFRLEVKSNDLDLALFQNLCPVPLFSPWVEHNLYPLFQSGHVRTNRFFIQGKYDQLRGIMGSENYSVIGLELECRDFTLQGGRPDLPFNHVAARVTLNDGKLSILDLSADFGQSTITRGNLVIPDVFRSDPSFEARVLGNFQLADIRDQSKMSLFPAGSSFWISQLANLEGRTDCQVDIQYDGARRTLRIVKGRFEVQDCTVFHGGRLRPMQISRGNIEIDPQAGNRFEGFGYWGNTSFHARGLFYIGDKKITLGETEINGHADLEEMFSTFYAEGNAFFSLGRPLPFSLRLLEQPGYYSCQGMIKLEAVAMEAGYFKADSSDAQGQVEFDLDYWPGVLINLRKAVYHLENSFIELTGYYSLAGTQSYSGQVRAEEFSLLPLGIYLPSNQTKLKGTLSGNLIIEGLANKPAEARLWGKLAGNDISFGLKPVLDALDQCHFLFRFHDREVIIEKLNMLIGQTPIRIGGQVKGWTGWQAELDLESAFLDLEELLPKLDHFPPQAFAGGEWGDIGLKLSLRFQEGIWKKIKLGPSQARLVFEKGNLDLQDISVNLEHGTVRACAQVSAGEKGDISLAGMIALAEQPLEEFTRSLNIMKDPMKGTLSLTMDFRVKGERHQGLIPSLNGKVELLVGHGLIKDARLFIKVLDLLNLQNIFRKRPPDLREEGFYFESMSGQATILNGVLKSENFVIRSPVFNAIGYGEIDLVENKADFFLGTQPHNTIDALLSRIPVLGYIITGDNKSFLTYYFKVTGAIDDPDVKLVPFEFLGKGVTGLIRRLLLTPFRMFNREQDENNNE